MGKVRGAVELSELFSCLSAWSSGGCSERSAKEKVRAMSRKGSFANRGV